MEDINFSQCSDHNNMGVTLEEKGEYELAKDARVASIAYLQKPFKDAL